MLEGLVASALIATAEVYGDDIFAQFAKQYGFEERAQPCENDDGHVRIAIAADGIVRWNGSAITATLAAQQIHDKRLDIYGLCLYVEGPFSPDAGSALRAILSAAAKDSIGIVRFTDAEFGKRVFPKFPIRQATPKP
jgi:hypothetical protein